jgi:predicted MFS family arabinose efflux permease
MGYALGALIAGVASDALGYGGAIALVAGLTAASGLWVLRDMPAAQGPRRSGNAGSAQPDAGITPMTAAQPDDAIRR